MGLTAKQNIAERPEEKREWTFKRLFPLGAISSLSKAFVNPFDVLLGFLVLVVGIAELMGRHVSWFFWVFAILILLTDIVERHRVPPEKEEKKK